MRNNWPYFLVASFLNAVLITGAFIEFKLRGMTVTAPPATGQPAWYDFNPFIVTGCVLVISFLIITLFAFISNLVSSVIKRLHSFNESMANQLAIDNGQ